MKIDMEEKKEKPKLDEEIQEMQIWFLLFSEEQLNHYKSYNQSGFPKAAIKRLIRSITWHLLVSQNAGIAVSGISRAFAGGDRRSSTGRVGQGGRNATKYNSNI